MDMPNPVHVVVLVHLLAAITHSVGCAATRRLQTVSYEQPEANAIVWEQEYFNSANDYDYPIRLSDSNARYTNTVSAELETLYNVEISGSWQLHELKILAQALDETAQFLGGSEVLWALFADARRIESISAEKLTIRRINIGRASYWRSDDVFEIRFGDDAFDEDCYKDVPRQSRPYTLGLRDPGTSAKISIIHELMHVFIDARPDMLEQYRVERNWGIYGTPVEYGPLDGRNSLAMASLDAPTGPEEDLVIASSLVIHAEADGAPSQWSYYLNAIYDFHVTFVHTAWGVAMDSADFNVEVTPDHTELKCRYIFCPTP